MRRLLFVTVVLVIGLLSGCSLVNGVNDSLNYVNDATEHINLLQEFAKEAPQKVQDARTSTEAKEELKKELQSVLQEIDSFNQWEPPAIAEDVHEQIVKKNEALKEVIETGMINGNLVIEELENSEMFIIIKEISSLMNTLEGLGL